MFYENFEQLCAKRGITMSRAAEDIGRSRSAVNRWKSGAVPGGTTLRKLADYFGVTVDFLLYGKSDLSFDDFTYALHNETRELTPENRQKLLELARFFKQEQDRKGK